MTEHVFSMEGYRRGHGLCAEARRLLAAGLAQPDDVLSGTRSGVAVISGSVGWLAKRTVKETADHGPAFAKRRPFDREAFE